MTAGIELQHLQFSSSHGPDVMVCNFLFTFFSSHKTPPFVQDRIILPSQVNKNQSAFIPRGGHHRPSGLHTFNISSSVLTPAEQKNAVTFLPNAHFHKAATSGQKCSFDYMLTQFLTQTCKTVSFISC